MSNLLASCCLSGLMFPLVAFFCCFSYPIPKESFCSLLPSPSSEMKCLQDRYLGSPPVVMALSCCHSFDLPGLFFKIFIQNVVILLLGAVLTHPWAFYGLFLFFILFLWTYPLELCSFHLWEGVGFICSCCLNFFRL